MTFVLDAFVLDASTALAWAFDDECDDRAIQLLESLRSAEARVPHIWGLEVANALVMAERRGRIAADQSRRFMRLLLDLPIAVEPVERRRPLEELPRLARTHGLSSYDAAYLDLALRYGIPLATRDQALLRGAVEAGVRTL